MAFQSDKLLVDRCSVGKYGALGENAVAVELNIQPVKGLFQSCDEFFAVIPGICLRKLRYFLRNNCDLILFRKLVSPQVVSLALSCGIIL